MIEMKNLECRHCPESWEYDPDSDKDKDAALLERLLHERNEHGCHR